MNPNQMIQMTTKSRALRTSDPKFQIIVPPRKISIKPGSKELSVVVRKQRL